MTVLPLSQTDCERTVNLRAKSRQRNLRWLLVALAIVFIPRVGLSQSAERLNTIPAPALKGFGDRVSEFVRLELAVGAEVLVIQKGKPILHESYGFSDRESEKSWENNTVCNIRSMTKSITSTAAQILIDRKQLDLDRPVAFYLPSFDTDDSKSITVRQVLTHRSGLPLTIVLAPRVYPSLKKQVDAIGERGPQFEPGEKFWYSDAGTDVVAGLVE